VGLITNDVGVPNSKQELPLLWRKEVYDNFPLHFAPSILLLTEASRTTSQFVHNTENSAQEIEGSAIQ